MPTRAVLQAAGRADIVRAIRAAGGSLAVAQRLGLRSRRRPVGFWDSTDNLDEVRCSSTLRFCAVDLFKNVFTQWGALDMH